MKNPLLFGFTMAALLSVGPANLAYRAPAFAQAKPPGGEGSDDGASYKAKTVYDFDDDMVDGDLQRPDGELINSIGNVKHDSLIELRKDFIPEMLKSLEDM